MSDSALWNTCLGDALGVRSGISSVGVAVPVMPEPVMELPSPDALRGLGSLCEKSFVDIE